MAEAADPALAGRAFSASGASLAVLPPAERISLRAPAASVAALSKALGVDLPQKPKTSAVARWTHARCGSARTSGWSSTRPARTRWPIAPSVKELHSAVGISHRNIAIAVTGPAAAAAINAGCPQDLSLAAFPVGACSRTILGKIEIVLLRTAEDSFPRRMLALVLRLCLDVSDRSRQGRGSLVRHGAWRE